MMRPALAQERAEFWSSLGYSVVLADGNPDAEEITAKNVTHIRSSEKFAERLQLALRFVRTPYVAIHPDDDYFTVAGLAHAVSILERSTNKGFAYGKVWELWGEGTGQSRLFPMYASSRRADYPKRLESRFKLQKTSRNRFAHVPYEAVFLFGVYAAPLLQRNLATIEKFEPPCYGGLEILNSLLIILDSQAVNSRKSLWVRLTAHDSVNSDGDSWDRALDFDAWFTSSFEPWVRRFVAHYLETRNLALPQEEKSELDVEMTSRRFVSTFFSSSSDQSPSQTAIGVRHALRLLGSRKSKASLHYDFRD